MSKGLELTGRVYHQAWEGYTITKLEGDIIDCEFVNCVFDCVLDGDKVTFDRVEIKGSGSLNIKNFTAAHLKGLNCDTPFSVSGKGSVGISF